MAKTQDNRQEVPQTPASVPSQVPAVSAPVSTAKIWFFWCVIALVVITARVLNHMLPGIPESVIERWVMLAFGAFLAAFLFKL